MNTRTEILDTAKGLINGPRQDTYGPPSQSFAAIAQMWSAYLGFTVEPYDVSMMMVLLKAARFRQSPHKADHVVDICGYAAITGEIAEELEDGIQSKVE